MACVDRIPNGRLSEADIALLDALHANPRASFEKLAATLGVAPVTVARRWRRLNEAGQAWVSSVPGPRLAMSGAVCEIEPDPGRAVPVAAALATLPQVISVYLTSNQYAVHTIVLADELDKLTMLLLEVIPEVPGALRVRSHLGTQWLSGARWRLGAITGSQRSSVTGTEAGDGRAETARTLVFDNQERELYLALQHDGRVGYRELARQLGIPEHQVRRQTESLLRRGMLTFRTDFARPEGGWPTELVLWLSVPHDRVEQVGLQLAEWPETRIALATIGSANLLVMAQLHQIGEVGRLRARLAEVDRGTVVVDESVVLRPVKSWGRLLGAAGHAVGVVPVDPWSAPFADFHH
ncbi:Lrp/AsnC family transcriptional regulator [Kitasatospora sp. NPDC001175]|uniref:Lrp/AsnC family transcriptional regulator n=1 Tax=Kitasatospora sp. NPDC001175 TaxID=3157103 RepID=UPI003D08F16B